MSGSFWNLIWKFEIWYESIQFLDEKFEIWVKGIKIQMKN